MMVNTNCALQNCPTKSAGDCEPAKCGTTAFVEEVTAWESAPMLLHCRAALLLSRAAIDCEFWPITFNILDISTHKCPRAAQPLGRSMNLGLPSGTLLNDKQNMRVPAHHGNNLGIIRSLAEVAPVYTYSMQRTLCAHRYHFNLAVRSRG
jgi:hypothetical protein